MSRGKKKKKKIHKNKKINNEDCAVWLNTNYTIHTTVFNLLKKFVVKVIDYDTIQIIRFYIFQLS